MAEGKGHKPFRVAKVTPPRIKRVFARKRLLRRLREYEEFPVVWVSAPAGSGKTTLIADYLERGRRKCVWLRLDSGDADPASVFHYLDRAVGDAVGGFPGMPRFSARHRHDLGVFTRRYFETLFLELGPSAVVVFDNFHRLPAGPSIQSLFEGAVGAIPEHGQIIFLSRNHPPPWIVSLRAGRVVAFIDQNDLRLVEQESIGVAALFESGCMNRHSEDVVRRLHHQVRGWIAGLILMLQAIQNKDVDTERVAGCARETIFHYFASELFDKADAEEQLFLLKSALLPEMPIGAVTRFTDHEHAESIFRRLFDRNYFVTRCGNDPPVYEYHPLFREFLLARGEALWSREELRNIRLLAADALSAAGQAEEAVDMLMLAGEWSGALREILKLAPALCSQGRLGVLGGVLERLPEEFRGSSPWFSYWMGICYRQRNQARADRLFCAAFFQFRENGDIAGMYRTIADAARWPTITRQECRYLDPWLSRFADLYRDGGIPVKELETGLISRILTAFFLRKPDHPLVDELVRHGECVWTSGLEADLRWRAGIAIAPLLLGRGELLHWVDTVGLFETDDEDGSLSPQLRVQMRLAAASAALLRGKYDLCLLQVERVTELAREHDIVVLEGLLLAVAASSFLIRGDVESVQVWLKRMQINAARTSPGIVSILFQIVNSWCMLLEGKRSEALEAATVALSHARRIGAVYLTALCRYGMAHVLFDAGEWYRALQALDRSCIPWAGGVHQHMAFMCGFSRAAFLLARGEMEDAATELRTALRNGASRGFGMPLWFRAELVEPLLRLGLERNMEVSYVQRLIRQARVAPADRAAIPANWPVPVRVHVLGRFELLLDGKPLSGSARAVNRPLEMLKVIIAFGCEEVSQEKVMDVLWPDASGDAALKSFHTTLHRLRKALGTEEAVVLKNGRVTLVPAYVWVDVRVLDLLLDRIAGELERYVPDENAIMHMIDDAGELFRGPFLGSDVVPCWAVASAERIRNRLLGSIFKVGRFWERRGRWEQAIACYNCGLQIDPLVEQLYYRLMKAHLRQGDGAVALEIYNRCRRLLASTLGVMPGRKIVQLYREILANPDNGPDVVDDLDGQDKGWR